MHCKECGHQIADDSKFCVSCGKPQNSEKTFISTKRWEKLPVNKSKLVIILLVLLMLLIGITWNLVDFPKIIGSYEIKVWNGETNIKWYKESKTEFTITTAEQLAGFAKLVNEGNKFTNKTVKLGRNIMLNDTLNWQDWKNTPPTNKWISIGIGPNNSFDGSFSGNGHIISGIYVEYSNENPGLLFGMVGNNGAIKKLDIVSSYFKINTFRDINELYETGSFKNDNNLNLTVLLSKKYLQIWARGSSLPKIFHNMEMLTLYGYNRNLLLNIFGIKENKEDPEKILMSVYNINDSAYLDLNNNFITSLTQIQPGTSVTTLAEDSKRTLECLPSKMVASSGVENICIDGKLAIVEKPRSAYDELAKSLIMLKATFIDSPDSDNIIVLANDDTDFDKIINVINRAQAAGFSKINLAKFDEEELKKLEEKLKKLEEERMKKAEKNFAKDLERLLRVSPPSQLREEEPQKSLRVRNTSGLKIEVKNIER